MILCAGYGLRFAKDGDRWRCVEYPELAMLRGAGYKVGDRTCATLGEALRQLEARGAARHQ
jgi:hypothetical protein